MSIYINSLNQICNLEGLVTHTHTHTQNSKESYVTKRLKKNIKFDLQAHFNIIDIILNSLD